MRFKQLFVFLLLTASYPLVYADLIDELGDSTGYTIAYKGYVTPFSEKYSTKNVVTLNNNQVFTLNCSMLPPLKYTRVIVFTLENSLLVSKFEHLPSNLKYNHKLLINDKLCDAFLE